MVSYEKLPPPIFPPTEQQKLIRSMARQKVQTENALYKLIYSNGTGFHSPHPPPPGLSLFKIILFYCS